MRNPIIIYAIAVLLAWAGLAYIFSLDAEIGKADRPGTSTAGNMDAAGHPVPTGNQGSGSPLPTDISGGNQGTVTLADIPDGEFRRTLLELSPDLRGEVLTRITDLNVPENDFDSLRCHPSGRLFYVCDMDGGRIPDGTSQLMFESGASLLSEGVSAISFTSAVPISSPPLFHSRPGSTNVLFLDFNGHVVTNTAWNSYPTFAEPVWDCRPYSLDADETMFSVAEQQAIQIIWERVAEDYAPFDIDVTTEHPSAWNQYTGHVLITPETDKNGVECPHFGAGGVAFVDVFGDPQYSYDFAGECLSPAWVLNYEAGGYAEYEAEAASHEMGHNLALSHDGTKNSEYYGGHENGSISWGPIMGTGYDRDVSQWSKGDYRLSDNSEDDLSIIEARIGYRPDDFGDDNVSAAGLSIDPTGAVLQAGIVEMNTDRDVFYFHAASGQVDIAVSPYRDSLSSTWGGNADLIMELYNASGILLATNNPTLETTASLSIVLNNGVHYLHVISTGVGDPFSAPSPFGYVQYGSIGQYTISGTVVISTDWDADGLPNDWEMAFFFDPTNALAELDADGDGLNNLAEYISGFDPTNASSVFRISGDAPAGSNGPPFVITWTPVAGRLYDVAWTHTLTNMAFSNLAENIEYPQGSYTDLVERSGSAHFYRVDVQLAP